jgi:Protein of unknown function (DUF1653)
MFRPGGSKLLIGLVRHSETKQPLALIASENQLMLGPDGDADQQTWVEDPAGLLGGDISGIWMHFKGGQYRVLGIAAGEGEEPHVIYLDAEGVAWARPETMFREHVERDGYSGPRFFRLNG